MGYFGCAPLIRPPSRYFKCVRSPAQLSPSARFCVAAAEKELRRAVLGTRQPEPVDVAMMATCSARQLA
jgi:hypothetical protein